VQSWTGTGPQAAVIVVDWNETGSSDIRLNSQIPRSAKHQAATTWD
jgi:hypothetical protein